ncbi:MAG: hypothetical protein HUJ16_00600 [Kangiella sp.]|nr:hypothetical protein [Kangiella sp.]
MSVQPSSGELPAAGQRVSSAQQIYHDLRTQIVALDLPPGQILSKNAHADPDSYTHLPLPAKRVVKISVLAVC